jgi:hypothetical protein
MTGLVSLQAARRLPIGAARAVWGRLVTCGPISNRSCTGLLGGLGLWLRPCLFALPGCTAANKFRSRTRPIANRPHTAAGPQTRLRLPPRPGQGRLLIGQQVTNLPHTGAELPARTRLSKKPVQRRLAIVAQLCKLPHKAWEQIRVGSTTYGS